MLTPERHQMILSLLKEKGNVSIHELVDLTGASESTLRRDLNELEEMNLLRRVHGGASLVHPKLEEPTMLEKSGWREREKRAIAKYAASLIAERDSIFIDAGTTTSHMIPYIPYENIIVVTNGVNIAIDLLKRNIRTILLGGNLKAGTLALIGRDAILTLKQYRFDKCFLGMNGVDKKHGLTTPDPDEAYIKQLALEFSDEKYILCDAGKFSEVTFAKVADLSQAQIITDDGLEEEVQQEYNELTRLKVIQIRP